MMLFVLGTIVCTLLGDLVYRFGGSAELSRKTVHVSSCSLIAAFPLFGFGYDQLVLIAAGCFVAIGLLRRTLVLRSVMAVERTSYGDLLLPLSVLILAAIGVAYPAFLAAYLVLGISDTLASLIGSAYGKRHYRLFGYTKSYAGSAAFFLSGCAILGLVAASIGLQPQAALLTAAAVSGALTLVEAFSHKGADNLLVPLIAAISLQPFFAA